MNLGLVIVIGSCLYFGGFFFVNVKSLTGIYHFWSVGLS